MSARRPRGFTLLELMTSVVITIIVLLAVAASFTAIQTVYQREAQLKATVEGARVASSYLERVTRLIGYGLDPWYAIDLGFSNLPGGSVAAKSNFEGITSIVGRPSNVAPPSGPMTTGFVTDDFAFRYRDPSYVRRATYAAGTVTLDGLPASFGIAVPAGRLLQLVCVGGQTWTVVRTLAALTAASTNVATQSANDPANPTSFPDPPTAAAAPCLTNTGDRAPYLMLVREVRLRIIPLGAAPNIRPFLVAYNSLDQAGVGGPAGDYDPIAADVESFQVSYLMNRGAAPVVASDWVIGNEAGEPTLPTTTAPRPVYDTNYNDPARFNSDVANVRAVAFGLSVRSLRKEGRAAFPQLRLADDAVTGVQTAANPDGFYRVQVSTTVRTPNLTSRTGFTPPLRVAGDSSPLNEWGG